MLPELLFYVFAGLTLVAGLLVVANPFSRSPVTSAMFLVLTMVGLTGLFVLLHAFFLAAVQILVYAGAVMVLFLFVIMLLDLRAEERRSFSRLSVGLVTVLVAAAAGLFLWAMARGGGGPRPVPAFEGAPKALGRALFTDFLLPFEIMSVLLLVAMVGVVLLSKKELR